MSRRRPRRLRRRFNSLRRRFALRPADSRVTQANLAQAVVTILVAAALAAGALLSAAASGAWQQSLREEIKRSAAITEDARAVYGDEAPLALELALAQARAAELAPGEAVTERKARFAIQQAVEGDHLIRDRYERSEGYDVLARLRDVRLDHPDLVALNPDAALARGDKLNRWAIFPLIATVALVLAFLVTDLVVRRRAKPVAATAGRDSGDLDLVPRPWSAPGPRRFGAFVALAAWLAVTLLPAVQLRYANEEQRAQALAARKADEVSSLLQVSGARFSFATTGYQRVVWLKTHAVGSALAANIAASTSGSTGLAPKLGAAASTESAVSDRAERVVTVMSRLPGPSDRIDAATRRALTASPLVADAERKAQNLEAERADRAGARSNRVTVAVLLGALAASLAALGTVARSRRPSLLDLGAAGVLAMSLTALASVPFV